jgi:hypothetical protein
LRWQIGNSFHFVSKNQGGEFAQALNERNQRRRKALGVLVGRMVNQGAVGEAAAVDLTDLLFALTSQPLHRSLSINGRTPEGVCKAIKDCCDGALDRARESLERVT